MKFGIVAAVDNPRAQKLAGEIKEYLTGRGQQTTGKSLAGSDLVVVLGGDGTLIHAACENVKLGVPFVGINVGTLGFLTAAEEKGWREAIDKLIDGKYVVSQRMTLEASVEPVHLRGEAKATAGKHLEGGIGSGNFRALNEIVVKGMYRVVNLEILVNSQKFLSITGDGVIVSTQTGSTAYSLSAGGPMVDPEVDCFLITPVNAHGLPIPSVVVAPSDVVQIKVLKGQDVSLIVDGQEHMKISPSSVESDSTTEGKQSVVVKRGKYRVKLGYFDKHHFLAALNAKFGLGGRGN